jgi:uncharacterized damage-inducible protein DinB
MDDLALTVAEDLCAYYEMVHAQTHRWVDPLSDEQLWQRPFHHGNSIGHLLLHMTGNLNYYIGARIAGTGYTRDREREFTESERKAKAEVLAAFDLAVALVTATIRRQNADDWLRAYSAEREPEAKERFHIFLRCAGHAYHHVGQIICLAREVMKVA